jgi:chromosome segregation ATPase
MVRIALAVLAATLAMGAVAQYPALGQNAAGKGEGDDKPGPPTQRYRFSHSAEGVLRLDNETGQVTLCRPLKGGWVCNPAPEETAVLQVELRRKDEEVKKLTAAFAQLKDELSRAEGTTAEKRKTLEDEIARLQAAIGGLKDEIGVLTDKIADAGKDTDKNADAGQQGITQEERQSLVSRLALLEQDNSGLKGALARLEGEIGKLKKKVDDAGQQAIAQGITQEERQGLVSRLALLEQDNSGIKGALARLENDSAELKKAIEAGRRSDLEPAIAQAIAANDALKRELAAMQDKLAAVERQVADDSARRALDAAIAQARDANDALKRELAATRDQVAALQKEVADRSANETQQADIERLKTEHKDLTDKLARLEMGNAAMQSEIDALKPPPPPPSPRADVPPDKRDELKLPSREDMDRARAALSDAWRRLMEMIGQLQRDMLGDRNDPPVRL